MSDDLRSELIFDWNGAVPPQSRLPAKLGLVDETLRDGLQNPSVTHPKIDDKLSMLALMDRVGIDVATIGMPGSSRRSFEDCLVLCRAAAGDGLSIRIACSARTVASDVLPVVELTQKAGIPIEVFAFVGSSPIRAQAEGWDVERIERSTAEALDLAVKAGLSATFVAEDASRTPPAVLERLFALAVDHGASRLCLCDTVGHATPTGTRHLVHFTERVLARRGARLGIDWHGHNDRGLALINALTALEAGADRVHGTALGIGERVGNAPMELILLNLELLGCLEQRDLKPLLAYCETSARALGFSVPANTPLVGRDAFRTATGVHASAISKAVARKDTWLADRVYSGVPAAAVGRTQEICIGTMSGTSNVAHWLKTHAIRPNDRLIQAILAKAKDSDRILTEDELMSVVNDSSA